MPSFLYMKSLLLILIPLVLASSTCFADDKIAGVEFRVYETVLSDPTYLKPNILLLVFEDHTSAGFVPESSGFRADQLKGIKTELGIEDALFDEFVRKNEKPCQLPEKFRFGFDVDISTITPEQQKELFKEDLQQGWKSFYRKYPNSPGIITLSRVAFNEAQDTALVYVGIWCGRTCGFGTYYLLRKENNQWKQVKQYDAWIS